MSEKRKHSRENETTRELRLHPDEALVAAYHFTVMLTKRKDGKDDGAPYWFGWAIRHAFLEGVLWEKERQ